MRSNKRKKGNGNKFSILLILILIAFVGILYFNQQNNYSTSTTAKEKQAQSSEPSDDVYTIYYTNWQSSTALRHCSDAMKNLQINVFYDDDESLKISAYPNKNAKNKLSWNGDNFKLKLSGSGVSPTSYTAKKTATDENRHPMVITKKSNGILRVQSASDFTYDGKSCKAGDGWYEFELEKILSLPVPASSSNTETVDNESVALEETITATAEEEEVDFILEEEEDDENEIAISNVVVEAKEGVDYEIPKSLGKSFKQAKAEYDKCKADDKCKSKAKSYEFTGETITKAREKSQHISLYCNYKLEYSDIEKIEAYNKRGLKDPQSGKITYYYYDDTNTHYYYGWWKHDEKKEFTYVYHTLPNGSTTRRTEKKTFTCKKKCEEVVKVEYGPPIQVDAGMCFEYRLKVTSITKCSATPGGDAEAPQKPSKTKICVLVPRCSHGHQAGPSDDFDACVNSCDGGKYTEACSNKCYDEVYNEDGTVEDVDYDGTLPLVAESMNWSKDTDPVYKFYYNDENGHEVSHSKIGCIKGQHYVSGNTYMWCPTQNSGKVSITNNGGKKSIGSTKHAGLTGYIGYWYYFQKYNTHWYNNRYASGTKGDGFIRAQYKNRQCPDHCKWIRKSKKCGKNSYYSFNYNVSNYYKGNSLTLTGAEGVKNNPGKTYQDYRCPKMYVWNGSKFVKKNICSTKDLIKADYANNLKKYKDAVKDKCVGHTSCLQSTATFNIKFSYKEEGKTTVETVKFPYSKYDEGDKIHSEDDKNPLLNTKPEVVLRYGGCYADHSVKNWYWGEWTFPGTWLPYKGDSSRIYGPADENEYIFAKGKVCLPYKLSDTNGAWAKYYVKGMNEKKVDSTKWPSIPTTSVKEVSRYDGYNITGTSTDFGLFKWKFTIRCFYALANEYCENCGCEDPPCDGGGDGGGGDPTAEPNDIRSVDTSDLFLQNTVSERIQARNQRSIGFNWTAAATLGKFTKAGGGYNQNPEDLRNYVQARSNQTFADPDFEFTIDVQTLREIRSEYKSKGGYGAFFKKAAAKGGYGISYTNDGHGVSHYNSELLGKLNATVKNSTAMKCNNMSCEVRR